MKIAIMTQPLGKNYGGIMQAWALQQVLKRMGHEVVTLDRQFAKPGVVYRATRLAYRATMKMLGKRKAPIRFEKDLKVILRNTHNFIANRINTSEALYSTRALAAHFHRQGYDAVIVGSDQTWRPLYSPDIYNYFLDFLESPGVSRISYASSFGVDTWEFSAEQTVRCAELAKTFSAISVREDSGVTLCEEHLGVMATQVLDPTLLLGPQDYLNELNISTGGASGQVFAYILDASDSKSRSAEVVAKSLSLKLVSHQPKESLSNPDDKPLSDYCFPSVEGWIGSFAQAAFVLTDSFHGCVFSILFEKPFLVIANNDRGAARFHSLLDNLGLRERIISCDDDASIALTRTIDWERVSRKLAREREKSLQFIMQALKHEHRQ